MRNIITKCGVLGLATGLALGAAVSRVGAASDDERLLADAPARIEKHRKADAQIRVLDAAGKPAAGARVEVRQTRHAFLFGCNIFGWGRLGNPADDDAYRRQFAQLFNYATLGFYWSAYESQKDQPGHDHAEAVSRWCREQGIAAKGHPLAWNHSEPRWLPNDPDEVLRLQLRRVDDCVKRFAGLIDRWDVVNEIVAYDRAEFLRAAPKLTAAWKAAGQTEFARACFLAARRAGPQATLLVNDFRTDPAYERVIEKLVDAQGKPLYDAIGVQSHMHSHVWELAKTWAICERLARFGVPLHFTELTIVSAETRPWRGENESRWPTKPEGEIAQARAVERLYTLLFSHPAMEAITWWDFADRLAWRNAPAGLLRKDLSPKPAYEALLKLIKNVWWTNTTVSADAAGRAAFRGFLGDYAVSVALGDQPPTTAGFTLRRGADNQWEIRLPAQESGKR